VSFTGLFFIAIALSMDAFAVAICVGLTVNKAVMRESLIVGLYFGIFQFVMPIFGYITAKQFADKIISFDHWIAFMLLCLLGGKMIFGSFKKDVYQDRKNTIGICSDRTCTEEKNAGKKETSLKPAQMMPLAFATSIDALAVGVSFAFLKVDILPAVLIIGITTLVLSMVGVIMGKVFGARFKTKAELAGGIILVLIGAKILIEHLM
jgi:putative Mn2+ efflux pump MntP